MSIIKIQHDNAKYLKRMNSTSSSERMDRLHAAAIRTPVEMNDIEMDDNEVDDPNNYGKYINTMI